MQTSNKNRTEDCPSPPPTPPSLNAYKNVTVYLRTSLAPHERLDNDEVEQVEHQHKQNPQDYQHDDLKVR